MMIKVTRNSNHINYRLFLIELMIFIQGVGLYWDINQMRTTVFILFVMWENLQKIKYTLIFIPLLKYWFQDQKRLTEV